MAWPYSFRESARGEWVSDSESPTLNPESPIVGKAEDRGA